MKKIKYTAILLFATLVGTTSCNKLKDFGNTNNNPNATTTPIVGALLTNVEAGLGGYAAATRGGLYCQYFSETQYTDASLYALPQLEFTGDYSGPLYDLQNIINTGTSNNQSAVAKILQSYIFWTITDRWGDVPYTEALQGNATPQYDSQETIYKGLLENLKGAIAQFDNASVITGDIIYGGDVASWKRLANSLRVLMSLRLSNVYPGAGDYAATELKAALSDPAGVIESNAENFTINYPGGPFKNPWYALYDGRKDYAESATMTGLMGSLNDARQNAFGSSNIGVPYGVTRDKATTFTTENPNWAYILAPEYRQENSPLVVVSAAEVYLARAEAADRGWTGEDTKAMYQAGINASFDQWGIAAPAASYFTQAGVVLTAAPGTAANLKPIAIQRYIATYPDGIQGWSIWRKTGYPVLTPAPDATNSSKQIPTRYTYGQGEYGTNTDAVEAAAGRIPSGDTQDSKVWWDQ